MGGIELGLDCRSKARIFPNASLPRPSDPHRRSGSGVRSHTLGGNSSRAGSGRKQGLFGARGGRISESHTSPGPRGTVQVPGRGPEASPEGLAQLGPSPLSLAAPPPASASGNIYLNSGGHTDRLLQVTMDPEGDISLALSPCLPYPPTVCPSPQSSHLHPSLFSKDPLPPLVSPGPSSQPHFSRTWLNPKVLRLLHCSFCVEP